MDRLLRFRTEFPSLEGKVYLISHSLGAMPARARRCLTEYADQWESRSIRAWSEGWWEMPRTVGNLVGRIIGAGEGEVVMMPNVSVANWIVTSCFDWRPRRNKIVSEGLNFTTNIYHYQRLAEEGARLITVESEDGITIDLQKLLDSIDEETALVSCSHILFRSAFVQDVKAIAEKAHRVGALIRRYLSIGGRRAGRRPRLRGRFRHGWLGEVALRRPGRRLPLCAPRPLAPVATACDRMDGPPLALPVRRRTYGLCGRRLPLSPRNAERPRHVCGPVRLRGHPRSRRREHPRQVPPPDPPADGTGRGRGPACPHTSRRCPAGRYRHSRCPEWI